MARAIRLAVLLLLGVGLAVPAFAGLQFSTDHRSLSFGLMRLGEEKILAQSGSFHNEVTCASTGGAAWYLKVNLVTPFSSGADEIPVEAFRWQLTQTDGTGSVVSQNQFRPFSLTPDLVYISGPGEDTSGTPVHLQLRYSLTIPNTQTAGSYLTTVRFTLTEVL